MHGIEQIAKRVLTLLVIVWGVGSSGCHVAASEPTAAGLGGTSEQTTIAVDLATQAVSADPRLAKAAIDQLRTQGPRGLQSLLEAHKDVVSVLLADPTAAKKPHVRRVRHAIDMVSGQRDGFASGLYWYDDLEQAKVAAEA